MLSLYRFFFNSKVLFPLMDGVQKACNSASTEKSEQKQIMVHHSRDTEEKQWQVINKQFK